ncbi:MAG: hypothetical protein GX102_08120 [Porphyromonadaceae bacterium]|nr:hypothetical protein [Porphyromonadaceae bacterium]
MINKLKLSLFIFLIVFSNLNFIKAVNINEISIPKNTENSSQFLFTLGTSLSPSGDLIQINSNNLLFNGTPQIPVMGEIHFSRFKDSEWKTELLKMRAGGITIVATYVFWIHHEETEGDFDWTGQRNLRKFIQTCKELDFPLILRIGPWCHGEVRNGGFPEWLVKSGIRTREDNPGYLEKVRNWYEQIAKQANGMMWKDGGPVIGIQLDNEYRGRGTHLMTLKKMAVDLGFDVPIYTRTGWPKLATPVPYGEIIPLYGDYPDGFWDRSLDEMPGDYSKTFLFRSFRNSTVIATEQLPPQSDTDNPNDLGYPFFTCELGGGMMPSYHRRINIHPMDIYAMTLVKIGSGSNLPGYYMYHGGNNPDGKLTTLNEHQATLATNHNDLPVETYDFQAPLGEFGQVNPHYHLLRKLHLFLHDFGSELALMRPNFPENADTDPKHDELLRWAVRSDGKSGYVFVNNYQRLKELTPKQAVQFAIQLPNEKLKIPNSAITIPSNSVFFIPFNLNLGGVNLAYATSQPITKIENGNHLTVFFEKLKGIDAEFVFDAGNLKIEKANGKWDKNGDKIIFTKLKTGTNSAIRVRTSAGKIIDIILLDEIHSNQLWKGQLHGEERVFLTKSNLIYHQNQLVLLGAENEKAVSVFPAPVSLTSLDKKIKSKNNGIFKRYKIKLRKSTPVQVEVSKIKDYDLPVRTVALGSRNVAEMPFDADFEKAAQWKITVPESSKDRDITLRIRYKGDVARIYSGTKLLTDNFYNGKQFDVNLKFFADEMQGNELILKILPVDTKSPIYFQKEAGLVVGNSDVILSEPEIKVVENKTVVLQ